MELLTATPEVDPRDGRTLDAVFGALADPTRRAILVRLTQGEASVNELVRPFTISQPAISRHLKVLEQAGLVSRTRRATMRLSKLEPEPLRGALAWLASYREFWEESFERLDELLEMLQPENPDDLPAATEGPTEGPTEGRSTS